ncbi:MAG TPA: hypothetical protein VGG74_28870 [Kofleriaceae bacterium]
MRTILAVMVAVVTSCHGSSGSSPNTPPAADAAANGPVDASHHDDATAACEPVGESCGNAGQCCSAYCHGDTCTCRSIGFACAHDADCCAGLGCTNGVCGNNDPNAYAVCQTCGSAAPCADGAPFCIRADGYADETYCASDCTANPNVCAPDMTCTALLDDQLQPTGKSGCLPNNSSCSGSDGQARCDVSCTSEGATCGCAGYTCVSTEAGLFCLLCTNSGSGISCSP